MTECTASTLPLASLGRRQVLAAFDGGQIGSDGGGLLLRQLDRHLGLIDALADAVADPRNPEQVTHEMRTLLAQRIYAIALGYEDGNDHIQLRRDPLLQLLAERPVDPDQPLASPATLSRFENGLTRRDLVALVEVLVEQFIASHETPPTQLVLDFDATDDPLHGHQEGRFFHGYYDNYCYLPLYVFCGEQLLVPYLRPANIDAARHSRAILKLLVRRLRQVWPEVRILFRADSGFCRWRLLRWCDRHGVGYIVGLARNERLQRLARRSRVTARWRWRGSGDKQRLFEDFVYAAESWDAPRRVIAKAEHSDKGANPRFVVTNLRGEGQMLYERLYCQRGEMENRIKEQQLDLFADRTSCSRLLANQLRLLLSSAAYVLVESLRRVGLAGTELARAQAGTIRLKLLKIGVRVRVSVRRVVLSLSSAYPLADLFARVLGRLTALPPHPS